jgi:hypothetical protein
MNHRTVFEQLLRVCIVFLVASLAITLTAFAQAPSQGNSTGQGKIIEMDRVSFHQYLKSLGYKTRGGIPRTKTDSPASASQSMTHFSSSFTRKGVTYPFTMLGYPPTSGKQAEFSSVIIPLRMDFYGFGPNPIVFDPTPAVTNIVHSPMYQNAQFASGFGQFGEMMQRASFWNKMDPARKWSVRMKPPRVLPTIDIEVTPETGTISKVGSAYFGDVLIDFIDAEAITIIQTAGIGPNELAVFVTDDVTAQALGYHSAYTVANPGGGEAFQTYLYTSWLDPTLVEPIFADVSTFNHENLEWFNDPFINNVVGDWRYPPKGAPGAVCSGNTLLEVGDPEGNGPTYADFPAVVVPIDGVDYHLQDLVLLSWFEDGVSSSAENGWYDFPATDYISVPASYCKH